MEFTFPSGERHCSPIWVREVKPQKSGQGKLEVTFWHAAYAEGVQDKCYVLRVLVRERGFLFATCEFGERECAGVLLTEVAAEWLRRNFPAARTVRDNDDLGQWLDRHAGRPGAGE